MTELNSKTKKKLTKQLKKVVNIHGEATALSTIASLIAAIVVKKNKKTQRAFSQEETVVQQNNKKSSKQNKTPEKTIEIEEPKTIVLLEKAPRKRTNRTSQIK